jgi:hypothetical protein
MSKKENFSRRREKKQTFIRDDLIKITNLLFCNEWYILAWRKVFEDNEYGKIDRIIWYDQESVIVTGQGRRVRALRYADGLEIWQLAATNSNQDSTSRHCQVIKNRFDPGEFFVTHDSFCDTNIILISKVN